LKNAILPKTHAKKSFLPPPCEERNPNMLVEDLMLIESDSVQFLLLSPCVSIVPSSWTKARETREQKNRKRQHLHCVSLETAALALRLVGFSVLHWKAKQPAAKEKQKLWRVNMCTRNTSQRS
jgi:hypothetical protein